MTQEEIKKLITEQGLELTDVIDAVIDLNGLVGVGLITLQDVIIYHIGMIAKEKSKVSAEAWMNS